MHLLKIGGQILVIGGTLTFVVFLSPGLLWCLGPTKDIDATKLLISTACGIIGLVLFTIATTHSKPRLFVPTFVGVCACWFVLVNPNQWFTVWQSGETTEKWLLALTPIGSPSKEVRALMERRNWRMTYDHSIPSDYSYPMHYPPAHGAQVIGADLGIHGLYPLDACYEAFWGFDANGKLIDLNVRVGAEHAL